MFTHSFDKVREQAGLPYNVTQCHIRHLFVTKLINNHVPVPVVSKMLGHSKVSTRTNIYYECRQAVRTVLDSPFCLGHNVCLRED
ncbi:MAG: tyrosine-type recombinase/integrase [Desulfovibrio sp.]|nr:tyrosine-type recombinase/integrase [Desulfovibrio sp.]